MAGMLGYHIRLRLGKRQFCGRCSLCFKSNEEYFTTNKIEKQLDKNVMHDLLISAKTAAPQSLYFRPDCRSTASHSADTTMNLLQATPTG